jgi:hypothetical protein
MNVRSVADAASVGRSSHAACGRRQRPLRGIAAAIVASVILSPCAVRADILFYTLPGDSGLAVTLEGSTGVNPGGTVTYTHPKFGKIHLDRASVDIRRVPTLTSQFQKQLNKAALVTPPSQNADACMTAAQWALRHGLLRQFHTAVDKALAADSKHVRALLVRHLQAKINADLGDSSAEVAEMRKLIGRSEMKVLQSKHFVLMHDTPDRPSRGTGSKTRAQERLELLETVYECFLLRFYASGVELEIPKRRLKVVLFNEYKDYLAFATRLSSDLASASGFWSPDDNTAIFFDHGTNEEFKELAELNRVLQQRKAEAIRERDAKTADTVRLADTLQILIDIERENSDIEVVSHEITHQMAGNTGLLPRHVRVPSWVHEGLATFFEAPKGAAWSGIGAVNQSRLDWYRLLAPDRVHSSLDFIVGDQIFDFAGNHVSKVAGYGQAWALTHFLMEKHFDRFLTFYRRLGEMPPDLVLSADAVNALFDDCFKGIPRRTLDAEWRTYMTGLRTDLELILAAQ